MRRKRDCSPVSALSSVSTVPCPLSAVTSVSTLLSASTAPFQLSPVSALSSLLQMLPAPSQLSPASPLSSLLQLPVPSKLSPVSALSTSTASSLLSSANTLLSTLPASCHLGCHQCQYPSTLLNRSISLQSCHLSLHPPLHLDRSAPSQLSAFPTPFSPLKQVLMLSQLSRVPAPFSPHELAPIISAVINNSTLFCANQCRSSTSKQCTPCLATSPHLPDCNLTRLPPLLWRGLYSPSTPVYCLPSTGQDEGTLGQQAPPFSLGTKGALLCLFSPVTR